MVSILVSYDVIYQVISSNQVIYQVPKFSDPGIPIAPPFTLFWSHERRGRPPVSKGPISGHGSDVSSKT